MFPSQSTLPDYHVDVFSDLSSRDMIHMPSTLPSGASGVSFADVLSSPAASAIRVLRGVGQDAPPGGGGGAAVTGATLVFAAVLLGAGGFLSYQIGKAMVPSGSSEKTWAWAAVPVGLFTGVLGLGIMGIVSNAKEK